MFLYLFCSCLLFIFTSNLGLSKIRHHVFSIAVQSLAHIWPSKNIRCCLGRGIMGKGAQKKGKKIGRVIWYPSQGFFFFSLIAFLPFAISLSTHRLLLLRSSQKKYYSISDCSLQHLYFIISLQASCPLVFFTLLFSSVVSMLKDRCQLINFTSFGKK